MAIDYSKLKDLKFLVADDEPDLRDLITFDLNQIGIITFEAGNYKESTKLFLENNIDFILSDFNMPGGNALKFITDIQTHKPNFTNIVFITGEANVLKREEFENKGIKGFFLKPISNDLVLDFVIQKLFS